MQSWLSVPFPRNSGTMSQLCVPTHECLSSTSSSDVGVLEGHDKTVAGLAAHPSRAIVASASYDTSVRVSNLEGMEKRSSLSGHPGNVTSVAFVGGATIASGGWVRYSSSGRSMIRIRSPDWAHVVRPSPESRPPTSPTGPSATEERCFGGRRPTGRTSPPSSFPLRPLPAGSPSIQRSDGSPFKGRGDSSLRR